MLQRLKALCKVVNNTRGISQQAGILPPNEVKNLGKPELENHSVVITKPCDKAYCRKGYHLCKNGFHPNGLPCGSPVSEKVVLHYTKGYNGRSK